MNLKKEQEKIQKAESEWAIEKDLLERKQRIKKEKATLKEAGKRKMTTSKKLITFLFINCTLIELFTGWSVFQSYQLATYAGLAPDLSPLVALIGAVVGEVIGYAVYAAKSVKENTQGGIIYMEAENDILNRELSCTPTEGDNY